MKPQFHSPLLLNGGSPHPIGNGVILRAQQRASTHKNVTGLFKTILFAHAKQAYYVYYILQYFKYQHGKIPRPGACQPRLQELLGAPLSLRTEILRATAATVTNTVGALLN